MNETIQQKKFRNAVGGYNKDDVNAYIKETDLRSSAALEELQKQIESLTAENASLQEKQQAWSEREERYQQELRDAAEQSAGKDALLSEKEALLNDLQKQADVSRTQAEAQNTVIEKLRAEKAQAETSAAELTEALRKAKEEQSLLAQKLTENKEQSDARAAEMEAALNAEKAKAEAEIERFKAAFTEDEESTGYKIRMYDRISGQIGDILLGANRNADDILNSAREDADKMRTETAEELEKNRTDLQAELTKIRQETEEEAIYIRERLSETAEALLAGISAEMHTNIENCLKELATCMTEVEYDTETMLQTMQNRYREMNDRIQYYQSCVQEHVAKQLADMDQKYGIHETGSKS